jgi:biopolymer transport protein ExbD
MGRAPSRARAVAEINVTPLVDVLLVLLIIFMLVAPLAPRALDTALPPPATGDSEPPPALVVAIAPGGLTLNRQPVPSLVDLAGRLGDVLATRADRTVFVQAEGTVSYGGVVEVMDVVAGAGAGRIGIIGGAPNVSRP